MDQAEAEKIMKEIANESKSTDNTSNYTVLTEQLQNTKEELRSMQTSLIMRKMQLLGVGMDFLALEKQLKLVHDSVKAIEP